MNTAKQAVWLFGLLIVLACSGWYFASTSAVPMLDDKMLSTTPDTYIHQLTVAQFDVNGRLINHLETPLMSHIQDNNAHLLENPRIVISQANQPSWDIQSEKAKALYGGERIIFSKDVIIHQNKGERAAESTLRTEEITYFPKTKKAETELDVTFEQPGTKIQSTGMTVDLAEKKVELLHQAQGHYVPARG